MLGRSSNLRIGGKGFPKASTYLTALRLNGRCSPLCFPCWDRWGLLESGCGFSAFRVFVVVDPFFGIWEGGMKILIDLSNLRIFDQIATETLIFCFWSIVWIHISRYSLMHMILFHAPPCTFFLSKFITCWSLIETWITHTETSILEVSTLKWLDMLVVLSCATKWAQKLLKTQ